MRLAGIVRDSIVDGPGVRDVIFFQGCSHHCKGCHNPQSWNPHGGEECSTRQVRNELRDSTNDVTISGGEPFNQISPLIDLVARLRRQDGKDIWIYTGYTYEYLVNEYPHIIYWLSTAGVEVIVDGRFEEDKKDPNLRFRGSSNQRLIDLKKSFEQKKVVLWEEC